MTKLTTKHDTSKLRSPDRPVSRDWAPFANNLGQVLRCLQEDQFLILKAKQGNRYLQFSSQGEWGMRVEVVSNHYLQGGDRLTRKETAWLRAHGWNAPTGKPSHSTPEKDPDGSPNYHIQFPASAKVADIVSLVIDTMIHGLSLPYPGALSYESFDNESGSLIFDELGLKPATESADLTVMDQVLAAFRKVTRICDLTFDSDGDVMVRYGAIEVCAMHINNQVRLISPLTTDASETPALLRKLNQINNGIHRIRLALHGDMVIASLDVPAAPFVPEHLGAALAEFSEYAEGLAIVLRAEFANKVVIEPSEHPVFLH